MQVLYLFTESLLIFTTLSTLRCVTHMQIRSPYVIRGFRLTRNKMYQGYPIFISFNTFASRDISSALNVTKKKCFHYNLITSVILIYLFHIFTDPLITMKNGQNLYSFLLSVCVCMYIYTGCFTTLGHNCRRWFPRSLWSKISYKRVSNFGRLRSYDRLKLRIEGNDYCQ